MKTAPYADSILRQAMNADAPSWASSSSVDVALCRTDASGRIREVTYSGYRRVSTPRTSAAWRVEDQAATNLVEVAFPEHVGNQSVTFDCVYLYLGDEAVYLSRLPQAKEIRPGDRIIFDAGRLTVTEE